ncbi:MAG: hypothetical protein EBV03_08750 [Proteobacteria bacterium]|nr:hypothetical protein [Pseudomonadota bacterium]
MSGIGLKAADSHQPAVLFEQRHGLKGIAGHYKFLDVPGWSWREMDQRFEHFFDRKETPEKFPDLIREYAARTQQPVTPESVSRGGEHRKPFLYYLIAQETLELDKMYQVMASLNPEAAAKLHFEPSRPRELSTVVQGFVSGFNTDDINYYLARSRRENRKLFIPREIMRNEADKKIVARMGLDTHGLGWIASPTTQQKIWEQVKHLPMSLDGPDGPPDAPLHTRPTTAHSR